MNAKQLDSESKPKSYRKLWVSLAIVLGLSFLTLGYYGGEIYRKAPPIPNRVVTDDGRVLFTAQDIKNGQNVWQSIGGQQVGSIWGHGAYVAPDWSADWLHREAVSLLDSWATQSGAANYEALPAESQAALRERLKHEMRSNTYNPETGDLVVSSARAAAIAATGKHYTALFSDDPELSSLRKSYAIPANSVKTQERREWMNAFFFWTAWSCAADRPGTQISYTQNWPHEPLIDNRPTGSIVFWSVI